MNPWTAWTPDWLTWSWVAWIVAFAVLETVAILHGSQNTLTRHLRPLFNEHPLTWWLTFGLWLWLGVHFLAPDLEYRLLAALVGH